MRGPQPIARAGPSRSVLLDVALAALFVVVAQVDVWAPQLAGWGDDPVTDSRLVNSVLLLGLGLPLAWRRHAPFAAITVIAAAISLQATVTGEAAVGLLLAGPVLIGVYSVAAYGDRSRALAGLGAAAVAAALHDLNDPAIRTAQDVGNTSYWWLVTVLAWLVGRYVGSRRSAVAMERRTHKLEREALQARAAVQDERLRIARELHDVVAHSVTVVAIQAGAAQSVLDTEPQQARQPLDAIESSARQALTEMRRLLGVLRDEDAGPALVPQPGLADVELLLERVREAGLTVELTVQGQPRPLFPGVDLSAFRIVQEALTNVLKHSGAGHTCVTVRYREDAVELQIVDDGHPHGSPRPDGKGLVGMRERVDLHGGTLTTGEQASGGFAVIAVLPVGGAPA
jgi:signal transduction histidine kinase